MRTINLTATEHATAHDAVTHLNFAGDHAISLGGRYFTISEREMARLQKIGIQPTTWHHYQPTNRLMSVPGNL